MKSTSWKEHKVDLILNMIKFYDEAKIGGSRRDVGRVIEITVGNLEDS